MTAREKAIEAAARELMRRDYPWWRSTPHRAEQTASEDRARLAVNAAAPHIESALLDRIEEAVKAQRWNASTGPLDERQEAGLVNEGIRIALAILTEIREEAGE